MGRGEAQCSSITVGNSVETPRIDSHPADQQGEILVAESQEEERTVELNQMLYNRGPEDDVNVLACDPTVPHATNIDVKVEASHLHRELGTSSFTCPISYMLTVLVDSGQNVGSGGGVNVFGICRHAWHLPA